MNATRPNAIKVSATRPNAIKVSAIRPNVILVITDDQGYGDLGCTGNPWIKTPNIDDFYKDSVHLDDFHVQPLCAPTRSAIMSGHRPLRNGVWATCWARSILRQDEETIADIFLANGYRTGMFGKWHLGDNYPYRPQDRGFQRVVAHKGGGVGQTPDFWGNNYFDDTYFHNGMPVKHEGYCTDVWFHEAKKFIKECGDEPYFAYIATNAPHSPYLVSENYSVLYSDNPDIPEPNFYGMITNIDENFGKLRQMLKDSGQEDNTILIFMTDNGSSAGSLLNAKQFVNKGYNANMRGKKGSYYDGGHRVPFIIRWPDGNISGGKSIGEMTLDVDILPTIVELSGISHKSKVDLDGESLVPLLNGDAEELNGDRFNFIQYDQGTEPPPKMRNTVMTRRWRLVYGKELYDIKKDPEQKNDIADKYPDVVSRLKEEHEKWWDVHSKRFDEYSPIHIGSNMENPTRLDSMDVMGDVAWNQGHVAIAQKSAGKWSVFVEQPGDYEFSICRWPKELNLPADETIDDNAAGQIAPYLKSIKPVKIYPQSVNLKIFDQSYTKDYLKGTMNTVFNIHLDKTGLTTVEASFVDAKQETLGAYYVYIKRL